MPGARIVLNSRYFHIARAGEKADGKHTMTRDAAMGLANYVGTRESVELNVNQTSINGEEITALNLDPLKLSAEVAARPATGKQMKTIADLLWEIPEAKKGLEYQDFKANPTIGNASELISYAAEMGLGFAVDLGKAKNLIEYVGKRPGVDRVGEHGLFSSEQNVDIRKAQEEIASCKGNIWTHVISLRREDADALGYDHQKPWRDLVLQKVDVIAKASNIPVSDLHWYAGMHNTTHHPHIHLFIFTDDPKVGHLNVSGINEMKAAFSEVIFADERRHIYEHKTEIRDSLKQKIDDILSDIRNGSSDQLNRKQIDSLSEKLLHLGDQLKDRPGKTQYGWIKDNDIRREVKDIMSGLAEAPAIRQLYGLYCEDHKDLQRMYRNDPKDIGPIIENREFNSIKNKIIRAAIAFSKNAPELDGTLITITAPNDLQVAGEKPQSSMAGAEDSFSDEASLFLSAPDERFDWMPPRDEENPFEPDSASAVSVSDAGNDRDWERRKPSKNKVVGSFEECFGKAMNGDVKAKYELAKKYFYGNGVERDYEQAQMWYGLATAAGHSFAKYELGKMYLYGIGIEKNQELGTEYCLDAYWDFRGSIEKSYGFDVGRSVDDGTAEQAGFSGRKDTAFLMYTLGRMEYAGEGLPRDYGKAYQWFRLSADGGHINSNYRLGKMFYAGEGVQQDYAVAESYYKEAANGKDKYAYYALGKMFDTGIGAEQNYKVAAEWYTKASMEDVSYADYRLAQMYSSGQGVEKDDELAGALYQKALNEFIEQGRQQPDADTEFRVANMYLKGLGMESNPEEGLKWLELCCEKKNAWAQYQLAGMYQNGDGVPQDEIKAQKLYNEALTGFLEQEKETPAAYVEYEIASMYKHGNGTEQDNDVAFQWYVDAAEKGHPHAAYCTARACYEGAGTEQSYPDAVKWYQKAAKGGDAYAMYALGKMFRDGIGVELNNEKAYQYFLAAAKLGHEFAQFAAAKALLSGIGVEKNVQGAVGWFRKCAEKGNPFAAYQLGLLLSAGKEIPKDDSLAQKFYSIAISGFISLDHKKPDQAWNAKLHRCFTPATARLRVMPLQRNGFP
ncbi:MobP3 family relaxase [Caproiciproducens sp.]